MLKIKKLVLSLFLLIILCSQSYSEDSIPVAAIFAKSGIAADANSHSLQGVHIAINEINQNGGVLGKKIELMEYDNKSTPIGSKVAADQAVKDGVVAIIGPSWSSHSLAVGKVAQANKIPMISNSSTNPNVTLVGNYIFRACFTDPYQGVIMADFLWEELEAKTVALMVNVSSDYSIGLAKVFRDHFIQLGGRSLMEINYLDKETDFIKHLEKIKEVSPDVLYIPGHDESAYIVKQAQELGINAILAGGDGWGGKSFVDQGGKELKRGYFSSHWSEEEDNDVSKKFLEKYKDQVYITAITVLGYDAANIMVDAIRRAESANSVRIRDALAETKDFNGATGLISFDENGDPIKNVVIMEHIKGENIYIKTMNP